MFNFDETEKNILAFWKKNDIFAKSIENARTNGNGESFVFFEGPPTANGRPGIHHLLARAFKDIIPRYKTMQGYHVVRKGGWDTHGLPVEIEVEKKLGVNSKREIENIVEGDSFASIVKFNEECKASVWTYLTEFRELTERYGYWIDMEHPYITYEAPYIESLWWLIAQFYERGYLKKDFRVAPYCFRCGTTLSSHELALGYRTVKDISIYAKFTVLEGDRPEHEQFIGAHILAWTTTPWTLPGNVGLAVSGDLAYVLVSHKDATGNNERIILAKDRLEILDDEYDIEKEFSGDDLVGLTYRQLFDISELQNDASHKVYAADFVTAEDGTGVVHTAVMYGADDYELGSRVGLPKVHTVNSEGKFEDFVPEVGGMPAKALDTDIAILKYLESAGLLFKKEKYEHEYPFCWRCKQPVLYYALESFVVEMSRLRDEMLSANEKITWVPEHIKGGRFGEWLREVKDWNFSRNRYWGTPLPIWVNEETGEMKVIQSYNELRELADNFDDVYPDPEQFDPHRPYIDKITLGGGKMKRVPYVADVWFDSGAMPFAQYHYPFENKELIDNGEQYPANFICEGLDQTRGWFYTLHAIATVLGREPSYLACISHGLVLDEDGKKMSKSLGNIVDPWKQIEQYGADAIRWFFFVVNSPGDEKLYSEKELRARQQRFLSTWRNTLQFLAMNDGDKARIDFDLLFKSNAARLDELDRWLVSLFHRMLKVVTESLDAFEIPRAARALENFVDDLSNWWVRRSRDDFKDDAIAEQKRALLATVLTELSVIAAPFVPFMSEYVYRELARMTKDTKLKESVHLEKYPDFNVSHIDEELIGQMALVRDYASEALKLRAQAGVKVRQPLQSLTIASDVSDMLKQLIQDEVNVKEIALGNELVLDTELTDELKAEGDVRDVIRAIQSLRKKAGLEPSAQAKIELYGIGIDSLISPQKSAIEAGTSTTITIVKADKADNEAEQIMLHCGEVYVRLVSNNYASGSI